jgi:hypothetical protein
MLVVVVVVVVVVVFLTIPIVHFKDLRLLKICTTVNPYSSRKLTDIAEKLFLIGTL